MLKCGDNTDICGQFLLVFSMLRNGRNITAFYEIRLNRTDRHCQCNSLARMRNA